MRQAGPNKQTTSKSITMKKIKLLIGLPLLLASAAFVLTLAITTTAEAQNKKSVPVKVKIVKIVDGDTSVIEQTMDQTKVEDFTKQFENIKGKDVQVMVTLEGTDKDKKEKQRSSQAMNFNFKMDSATAHAFSKCIVLSEDGKGETIVWDDSLMKNHMKDFDFKFDFDEATLMKDLNFDITTENDGKTTIIKNGNGKTIVINGDEEGESNRESDMENGKTKTQTKTIVINDEENHDKKKVIVSTTVTVIDMNEKGPASTKSEKRSRQGRDPSFGGKAKDETNVNFYTNPSDGNFTLELELEGKEPAQVRITDMDGKEVYTEKITGNGKVSKNLKLDGKKGTFIVTIKQGNKIINKKIIIE